MLYFCCDKKRKDLIKSNRKGINGIDFIEVHDDPDNLSDLRQRLLFVHFINEVEGSPLSQDNFQIEGGQRVQDIFVTTVEKGSEPNILNLEVNAAGDFSTYTLRIVKNQDYPDPPENIDPMFAEVDFSFKVECPSDFDCKVERVCPSKTVQLPDINYLAKDYTSFKRLMLDRMALNMPDWQERNPADLGVALVELLAYAGDHLSYRQDAVATEAYLHTARKRVSVRRHARLVDYHMHDGCNARTWVQVKVSGTDPVEVKRISKSGDQEFVTKLLTHVPDKSQRIIPHSQAYRTALAAQPIVFELCEDKILYSDHDKMSFYTWSDRECCLPKGATHATLKGHFPKLQAGDVLILAEVKGPNTGSASDARHEHRHPVRLTAVKAFSSGMKHLKDPLTSESITEISWARKDALPFPLCLSSRAGIEEKYIRDVSVAYGNIVFADHGCTVGSDGQADFSGTEKVYGLIPEHIGVVPESRQYPEQKSTGDRCERSGSMSFPLRFWPKLKQLPLTHAASYNPSLPACSAMQWSTEDVKPAIRKILTAEDGIVREWGEYKVDGSGEAYLFLPEDLLNSGARDEHFVVEIEKDGTVFLRFGDDRHGKRPGPGTEFGVVYRVGNGVEGNIGAEALTHIVTYDERIVGVQNLLPAQGGMEPESMEEVRQNAPFAFRTQERAVTPRDYEEKTGELPNVQKASATMRWTGSWHTVFLTADRMGGLDVDSDFEEETRRYIEQYRMAGHDLEVNKPQYVPLEIEMKVCVDPGYFRSEVKKALLEVFSRHEFADGRRGIFHPDNFTFGQTVYLSPMYAAAHQIAGVASVSIVTFQRQGHNDLSALQDGKLELNRLEIVRLDNDPNFPERGLFRLEMGGGK